MIVFLIVLVVFLFFFSSRRRHTRWTGDWSSDVCSSDLSRTPEEGSAHHHRREQLQRAVCALPAQRNQLCAGRQHSQIRRRAFHASSHRGSRQGTARRKNETFRSRAREYGLSAEWEEGDAHGYRRTASKSTDGGRFERQG